MKTRRLLVNDIVLCVAIIIFCLCVYGFMIFRTDVNVCRYIEVFSDGKLVETLSLEENTVYTVAGHDFSIEISDGNARVTKTDCDDRTCESMSAGKNGGQIVCLPNKIVVRAKKADSNMQLVAG